MNKLFQRFAHGVITLSLGAGALAFASSSTLEHDFKNPPHSSKPQSWLHAMSGNMSKAGITKDLEAIADVGLGGIILFNVSNGVPYGNVKFNSDEHINMMGFMAKEAKRLDLSFGIHNCDGWTSSGGPWVTPEHSMKKVVWTQQQVQGGKVRMTMPHAEGLKDYYEDIAVIAYPSLPSELRDRNITPVITSSDKKFNADSVTDGTFKRSSRVNVKPEQTGYIQFSYEKPYTLRGALINMDRGPKKGFTLETSNDGKSFTLVKKLRLHRLGKKEYALDPTFDGLTAKHFRFVANGTFNVLEASLTSTPTIPQILGRTSRGRVNFRDLKEMSNPQPQSIISSDEVINLSAEMDSNGNIKTELPQGDWTVIRFGFTTTGAQNSPASKEGKGLETDKFSREAFKIHYDEFVTRVLNEVNKVAPGAMKTIEIDSYEVGGQNWTHGYQKLFSDRFNYSLAQYLPIFTGRFVDSAEKTELILNNIRTLNSELMVENYYGYFTELANADGLKTYIEPYGNGPFNDMDAGAKADIPMGEFWLGRDVATIAPIVSAAHINNKKIISAEGFTSQPHVNWNFHPGMAKTTGDKVLSMGVNELFFHRFAHQANTHVKPGMIMGKWGANFDRTQTWWDTAAKSWVEYITRIQHMQRQGLPATDMLTFIGDGTPNNCRDKRKVKPKLPNYLNFDCVTPAVLKSRFSVENNRLVLPEGTSYKLLHLIDTREMTVETLQKIDEFSKAGIVIVGERPKALLALTFNEKNSSQAQKTFDQLVKNIWGRKTTYVEKQWDRIFEENNFYYGFKTVGADNLLYSRRKTANEDIFFIANITDEARVYESHFDVTGKIPEQWNPLTGEIKKLGQFSHKDGRTIAPLKLGAGESTFVIFRESSRGINHLPFDTNKAKESTAALGKVFLDSANALMLDADKNGPYSVVHNTQKKHTVNVNSVLTPYTLGGAWKVKFNPFYGYGETLIFDKLVDWKDHTNKEIKYYSGTATYSNTFNLTKEYLAKKTRVFLDLGKVSVSATVTINGQNVGTAWVSPYRLEITDVVRQGENAITIDVANQWTNRLIGDKSYPDTSGYQPTSYFPADDSRMPEWYTNNEPPPPGKRRTFATHQFYQSGDPLVSSGLIGPVSIKTITREKITLK